MASRIYEVMLMVQEKRDAAGNLLEPATFLEGFDRPEYIVASDDVEAAIKAGSLIPESAKQNPELYDRLEKVVRPF